MKKVFFLFAFLFAVVCYAASPPDKPTSFLTEDVGVIRSQGHITVQVLEVQEVAFVYLGNSAHTSMSATIDKSVADYSFTKRLHGWESNKQNTNFGYPFGADYNMFCS